MRTKLLANYKGSKVQISGRALLEMVDDVSKVAGKSTVPGQGTLANPYKPSGTIDQRRGLAWTTSDTYYHVGISLLCFAPGNYAYLPGHDPYRPLFDVEDDPHQPGQKPLRWSRSSTIAKRGRWTNMRSTPGATETTDTRRR